MSARGRIGPVRNRVSTLQQTAPYRTNGSSHQRLSNSTNGNGTNNSSVDTSSSASASSSRPNTVHPFFQELMTEVKSIHNKIRLIQTEQKNTEDAIKQLQRTVRDQGKKLFKIQGSPYQAGLNEDAGRNFCENVRRELTNESLKAIITSNLGGDVQIKYKYEAAKAYLKHKFTEWRSEERRRIFGRVPCQSFRHYTTGEFAEKFLATLKLSGDEILEKYKKNLALLRKFVYLDSLSDGNLYSKFRKWMDDTYGDNGPTDEEWKSIMADDEQFNYEHVIYEEQSILEEQVQFQEEDQYLDEPDED